MTEQLTQPPTQDIPLDRRPQIHYGPTVLKEIEGGHMQTSEDILGVIARSAEQFGEEDRTLMGDYSRLRAYAYVANKNSDADESHLAAQHAATVFSEMSQEAQQYVSTDIFDSLVTRLSTASRLESY